MPEKSLIIKMRIVLRLKANKTVSQKDTHAKFFTAMHGFIYKKLSDSKFKDMHDKKGFKGFCFGNIYPIKGGKIESGKQYSLIISSPLPDLIQELFFSLSEGENINLGESSFTLEEFYVKQFRLSNNSVIETATILNLTRHENDKIIALKFKDSGYLDALSRNLIRKYNYFNKEKVEEDFPLFENIKIDLMNKGELAVPLLIQTEGRNDTFTVIGNKLRFKFGNISEEQLKIMQFCFDIGFAERNSYGMGFMVERFGKK